MDNLLEKIPRWVWWTAGGGLLLLFLSRGRQQSPSAGDIGLNATLASMQLAAASNIEALTISSSRDVALAGEYTNRMAIAHQASIAREEQALAYLSDRSAGKNSITSQRIEADLNRHAINRDFALQNRNLKLLKRQNDQNFKLAKQQQKFDFVLDKEFLPEFFEIQLRNLTRLETLDRQQYDIQSRRLDIRELQSLLGSGGVVQGGIDAFGNLINTGFGIYDRVTGGSSGGSSGPSTISNVASGAAQGAAIGSVVPGVGNAVGAVAGGAGGLS